MIEADVLRLPMGWSLSSPQVLMRDSRWFYKFLLHLTTEIPHPCMQIAIRMNEATSFLPIRRWVARIRRDFAIYSNLFLTNTPHLAPKCYVWRSSMSSRPLWVTHPERLILREISRQKTGSIIKLLVYIKYSNGAREREVLIGCDCSCAARMNRCDRDSMASSWMDGWRLRCRPITFWNRRGGFLPRSACVLSLSARAPGVVQQGECEGERASSRFHRLLYTFEMVPSHLIFKGRSESRWILSLCQTAILQFSLLGLVLVSCSAAAWEVPRNFEYWFKLIIKILNN